jgi:hypothetical protein
MHVQIDALRLSKRAPTMSPVLHSVASLSVYFLVYRRTLPMLAGRPFFMYSPAMSAWRT